MQSLVVAHVLLQEQITAFLFRQTAGKLFSASVGFTNSYPDVIYLAVVEIQTFSHRFLMVMAAFGEGRYRTDAT